MSYVTQQQLIDRFGEVEIIQLTDRSNAGAIDAAVLAAKIADADALIDSYVQGRYTVPMAAVPDVLVRTAADIVRYDLMADRATEQATTRYKAALAFLHSVSKGDVQLGAAAASQPVATSSGPQVDAPGRTFTLDGLRDMDAG